MTTFVDLPRPDQLRSTGRRLHHRMAKVSWPEPEQSTLQPHVLQLLAAFIDVLAVGLAITELVRLRGISTWQQLEDSQEWIPEVQVASGVSPDQFAASAAVLAERLSPRPGTRPSLDQMGQEMQHSAAEFLRSFPVAEVCNLARCIGEEALAHRIQVGTDQLSAIHRRMHVPESEQFRIAAMAYAKGAIEIDVAANLLGLGRADLLAALEVNGFTRPPEVIALDAAHRSAIRGRLRANRLERSGTTTLDPDLVARDVIASQRIEDVDARRWLLR